MTDTERGMRVAIVGPGEHDPDAAPGTTAHVGGVAAALRLVGHEVTEHAAPGIADHGAGQAHDAVRADRLGALGDELVATWLRRPPDVVHAFSWTAGLVAALAARRVGAPVVLSLLSTALDAERPGRPGPGVAVVRTLVAGAGALVVLSRAESARLRRLGAPAGRIRLGSSGVDAAVFEPRGRDEDGDRAPGVVVARAPRPGEPSPPVPTPRGAPPSRVAGNEADVRLLDADTPADEVRAALRAADVLVCGPGADPLAVTALRAMACGVAVVATTDAGAVTDVVVDGVTGLVARPGGVADAVRALLADPMLREGCGIAGRDRAESCFAWTRVAGDLTRVYASVSGRQAPTSATSGTASRSVSAVPAAGG